MMSEHTRATEEARLVAENAYGVELRYTALKAATWPGYDESLPLGKAGFWVGTHRDHTYLGRSVTPQMLEFFGFDPKN